VQQNDHDDYFRSFSGCHFASKSRENCDSIVKNVYEAELKRACGVSQSDVCTVCRT